MKEKFLLLKAIQPTALQLETIRTLLNSLDFIEIENDFFVSCAKSFKDLLSKSLNDNNIYYILVYVNLKVGCDVFTNGITDIEKQNIEQIIIDK